MKICRIPDVMYVVDLIKQIAVKEAKKLGIPKWLPWLILTLIPMILMLSSQRTTMQIRAVKLTTAKMADAVIEGRQGEDMLNQ